MFAIAKQFLQLGFTHVIPLGFDHLLFILCIFVRSQQLRNAILYCSVFTLAHSVTLALATVSFIELKPAIVEPLIALSILVMALQNIAGKKPALKKELPVIFLFGLIHGLGFAAALKELDFAGGHLVASLLFFNVGVELAQLLVILIAYWVLVKGFSGKRWYQERVILPLSSVAACVACYWLIQRVLQIGVS